MTRRPVSGFTLIELAVLLSVAAVAAALMVPDIINAARMSLARKTAEDMARLHDGAKWFYLHSTPKKGGEKWPGEANPGACTPGINVPVNDLRAAGYLPPLPAQLLNPWGERYEIDLVVDMDRGECFFRVGTKLPRSIVTMIEDMSPYTGRAIEDIDDDPDTTRKEDETVDGYTWFSSATPRPGTEEVFD
jgi:hypothetical protein